MSAAAHTPLIAKDLYPQLQLCRPNGISDLSRRDGRDTLPGQPRIKLQGPEILEYLRREHCVQELDKLAPWLSSFGIVTPNSANISPLHHHISRGRKVITEQRPGLHLVWYYDRLFVKPIPRYMLSAAFWTWMSTTADPEVWKASVGFMRSYNYLLQYDTDFNLARSPELGLITVDCDFEDFIEFISQFLIGDEMVCPRYSLGQLRLSRLNIMAKIFLGKFTYFHLHYQWADYLQKFVAPLLTIFVVLSTLLGAMQVALSVQDSYDGGGFDWRAFRAVCVWFSVAVLIIVSLANLAILSVVVGWAVKDQVFAHKMRRLKKSGGSDWREYKSGLI